MIRHSRAYSERAVYLLQKHNAHQRMRKSHLAEAESFIRRRPDPVGNSSGASDNESDLAATARSKH